MKPTTEIEVSAVGESERRAETVRIARTDRKHLKCKNNNNNIKLNKQKPRLKRLERKL